MMLGKRLFKQTLTKQDMHAKRIRKFFQDKVHYEGPAIIDGPLLLMAFTNRSGSNLLADRLRSTGRFSGFSESLNYLNVDRQRSELDSETFPDHIAKLHQALSDGGATPGFKAGWGQLAMLLRWNIPAMFQSLRIIHIRRQDVLDQAVSFSIAYQTQQWTSRQRSKGKAKYSYKNIAKLVNQINQANNSIASICSVFSLQRTSVFYEDLIAQPEREVKRVSASLGFEVTDWTPPPPSIDKQANELNREFRERFAADSRSALLAVDKGR
ncbi:Stf0 family sulfotransferase [Breoghania sp.]|uniref:Stf0 family sulfotransferase n=1 Tax=Breoghania sp. TaxID=2065378 RepID=UPI0029C9CD52|nr:Stf0 family sulfotransferase [Breoghania sp.]